MLIEGLFCNVVVFYDYLIMWLVKFIYFICNDEKLMYVIKRFFGRMGFCFVLWWYKFVFFFKCNDMFFNMYCILKVIKNVSDKMCRMKMRRVENGNVYIY